MAKRKAKKQVGKDGVDKHFTYETWAEVRAVLDDYGLAYETVWCRWAKGKRTHGVLLAPPQRRASIFIDTTYAGWAERVKKKYGIPITPGAFGSAVARWRRQLDKDGRRRWTDMEILELFDKRFKRELETERELHEHQTRRTQ